MEPKKPAPEPFPTVEMFPDLELAEPKPKVREVLRVYRQEEKWFCGWCDAKGPLWSYQHTSLGVIQGKYCSPRCLRARMRKLGHEL